MPPPSLRIIDTAAGARPYAAWLSGLAVAMLAMGSYGALHPLLPPEAEVFAAANDSIEVTEFEAPSEAAAAKVDDTPDTPPEPEPDVEIPPMPEIVPPLTPPEVPELIPEDKAPPPAPRPTEPKPKKKTETKPRPQRSSATAAAGSSSGTSSTPTLFSSSGGGRFPEPSYPRSARSARAQGTVRLLITVEASGLPSSVEVQASSGFSVLDSAARDHIRRRWRWPSGAVRLYIVPVRFQLR